MSFRRVINYHRIIEFSWLSEPPLPRAPHFRRRRGKFQAGLVAIKRKNGIDRLRFALVRPRQIRVINYVEPPVVFGDEVVSECRIPNQFLQALEELSRAGVQINCNCNCS